MKRLLLILALCAAPVLFTACPTTTTHEAVVYYTFADTWAAASASYGGFCERVVSGKVAPHNEAKADAAWNKFRASFKLSLRAASMNWNATTPAEVRQLSDALLAIIRSL